MTARLPKSQPLIDTLIEKATLKQEVYRTTLGVFNRMRGETNELVRKNKSRMAKARFPLLFDCLDRGEFEFRLSFGSDVLVFFMHSNVFEIPRDHDLMKERYIREDKSRSYCGIIHIFNFLADSFRYNRTGDTGYCIGRIFVNREEHYFVEGKSELGGLYHFFPTSVLDTQAIRALLEASIRYTVNFDLLTPPFDSIKEVTLGEMQTTLDALSMKTGKRLGFRFQADGE